MIRLLIKLAIVALLANAAFHIGSEYLTYVRFRDGVRDAAMFKAKNDTELMARIMDLAEQYEVPLDEENVTLERNDRRVNIDGWYDKPIEIVPNYQYPWHFSMSLEVLVPASVNLTR
ncbi:MAG TPA: hypothetical protein VM032_11055 [Vicinamibacterales bacterium]|nr:hypothetical protein [Vicinamibacterales bacterium]